MSRFLLQAEEILETATAGAEDVAIVVDRLGGLRMLPPAGWSLHAMRLEFGAAAVYKVERRGSRVRVEGWNGEERCLLERPALRPAGFAATQPYMIRWAAGV